MSGWKLEDSGTGRSATQKATSNAAWVDMKTLLAGELQQFNRMAGGAIVLYKQVTSDATGLNIAGGPAIFYGALCTAATTAGTITVYDGVTAAGTVVLGTTVGLLNTFYGPGQGIGVLCNTGITVDWATPGTWLIFYVPSV